MNIECKHMHTISKGESGSFCRDCGIKVLETETRPCKDCNHFNGKTNACRKLMMMVYPDMNVCYKVSEGTCFNSPEDATFSI